ncbi:hypothetical protein EUTSA_v10009502mg [Eutrema salsugineum]|uniref:Bet v I/Major latex protein domain-containing protein n=1 Tax=Eutrema salsugineum TaxID=72664 RepID=V4L3Q8_EUTSA|nr:uncharacterized protein At1g24000 [Eutrema salsugineum]ESQ34393.1 hypothetical protein EUTSA_v10009502mg [Eutrema salsugineum]
MTLNGALSVDFDVKSPADKFFKAFVGNANAPTEVSGEVEIEAVDWVKRVSTMKMKGVQKSKRYKTLKGTITVTPKERGNGSRVVWTVRFEKVSDGTEDPHFFVDEAPKYFKEIDDHLLK